MAATHWVLSKTEIGSLEIYYKRAEGKSKIAHFCVTDKENNVSTYVRDQIWINSQPAACLKKFNSQLIQESDLIEYKVIDEDLYLRLKGREEIELKIACDAKDITYSVSPNLTILGLRKMLQKELKRFDFELKADKGGSLQDSDKVGSKVHEGIKFTVEFAKNNNAELEIANRGKGGQENFSFSDLSFVDFINTMVVNIKNNVAPPWLFVSVGLNFLGKCENTDRGKCPGESPKLVIAPMMRMGYFNVSKEISNCKCPQCKQPLIDVKNCVFWNCEYIIEGMKVGQKEPIRIIGTAPLENAISFTKAEGQPASKSIEKWIYLEITVSEKKTTSQTTKITSYNCLLV